VIEDENCLATIALPAEPPIHGSSANRRRETHLLFLRSHLSPAHPDSMRGYQSRMMSRVSLPSPIEAPSRLPSGLPVSASIWEQQRMIWTLR
jgi:hypothetical protein